MAIKHKKTPNWIVDYCAFNTTQTTEQEVCAAALARRGEGLLFVKCR